MKDNLLSMAILMVGTFLTSKSETMLRAIIQGIRRELIYTPFCASPTCPFESIKIEYTRSESAFDYI